MHCPHQTSIRNLQAASQVCCFLFYTELLERTQLPEFASAITQQLAIENDQFRRLLDHLREKYGRLYGVKPSVCGDHRESLSCVQRITWGRELRQIKRGIHLRICSPGIHELQLFCKLETLQQTYSDQLRAVLLYPGLDRYDLQLRFRDGAVWAIDVKDYRSPYQLAAKLLPIYGEGTLQYNESFYVVPGYRVLSYDNYTQIGREEAIKLPLSTHILSDAEFEQRVITKISSLKQGK